MLRVNGQNFRAGIGSFLHDYLACADKSFLVGEGKTLFFLESGHGGHKTHRAGHGRNHGVGLGQRRRLENGAHAAANANVRVGKGDFKLLRRVLVVNRHQSGAEHTCLFLCEGYVFAHRQRSHAYV